MAKKKKENKNQIMTTDAIVTVDRKGEVKQTKPTKNNSYRDEYNYRNNLNPTTERVQTGKNNFKDITSTVSRNVLRNTNKEGYLDTKKKYGDYNKNDLSKSNYKIYQKDNKYYYFDEKDKKYKDMKGYETTTHKIDGKDSGLLNISNKNEMLQQNKERKTFNPKFVQTTEQKDISKKISSDMAADDAKQEEKWLNSLSKEDKKAYEESAKYLNKEQKKKHKEAQQREIKKQQQLRFEKDKEAFQKFQNKEQAPSLIEAGNYVRENKAKEEEYLKNNPVAIKGSNATIRPQDVIPTLGNYKTGEIAVETQPERLETAKERNELAMTEYQQRLWEERNKETTGLEKVYRPVQTAIEQIGEGLDTPFDFGNRVYIGEDGTQQYLPSRADLQWERTLNSYNTKIGKFAAETTNNLTKILGTQALNLLVPGSGTAVYWTQMYGNAFQKAFNQTGGDSGKASANALINTGLEFLTGKFLGSATKGLTGGKTSQLETAYSNLAYRISKNPTLSSYLGKAGSEFSEEFIQEYLGNAVDILTLGSDGSHENVKELLSDPDVLEAALYSGLMGAVSSVGIGGVQNLGTRASGGYTEAQSIQLANDFRNELSNTIEEYKKNPKDNKSKIKKLEKVLTELDKELQSPFTDDTVQSNIDRAENINKSINSTYSDEQKAQIDEIEQMVKSGEIDADEGTGYVRQVQNGTYAEHRNLERIAQQRMDEVQQAFREGKISGDEYNRELKALNATIQSERNRIEGIDEQIETNIPQSQAETNETIQQNKLPTNTNDKLTNFRNSVANENVNDADGFYKSVEKIIKDKDYNVILDSSITNEQGNPVNAVISNENGITIRINPKSERAGEILLTHEITHGIETKEMSNLIMDYASKNSEFNDALQDLKKAYGTEDITPEVVADISGQLLGNQEFIKNLSTQKPNIFKQIYDKIIEIANKITGNSNQKLFIKDLKNKWEKAYRESNIQSAQQNLKEGAKYSQNAEITDNKGRPLNINMQNYMEDSQATNDKGQLVTLYHTTTDMIKQFNIFDPANKYDPSEYKFGKYNVTYLTDGEEMSESYSMYEPRKADTRRLNDLEEARKYLDNTSLHLVDIKNTNQAIKNHFKGNKNRYFLVSGDLTTFGEYKTEEELLRDVIPTAQQVMRGDSNFKYELYANIKKPYIIDAEGRNWNNIAREINEESKKIVESLSKEQKEELSKYANESLMRQQAWQMSKQYSEYLKYEGAYDKLDTTTRENLVILSMKDDVKAQDYREMYDMFKEGKDPDSKINVEGEEMDFADFAAKWCYYEMKNAKYAFDYSYFLYESAKKYKTQLQNVGVDKMYEMAKYNFRDWAIEDTLSKRLETNDIVKKVIEMNEKGEDYDGVIIKNTTDYGVRGGDKAHDLYVVFNSNQLKAVDNPNPTDDPDIRYSQKADKWQKFLDKYYQSKGTTTVLKDKIGAKATTEEKVDYWKSKGVEGPVAKILSTDDLKEENEKSLLQKIKDGKATIGEEIQQFKRKFVDKGSFIRKLSKLKKNRKLDAKYDKMGTAEAEAQYSIGKAQSNLKGIAYNNFKDKKGKRISMSWNDIWKGIDEDLANEYLANWLNVDRYGKTNEAGRKLQENLAKQVKEEKITQQEADKILEEKRENGELYKYVLSPEITDKDSAQRIAELDEKHPELKLFAENVWQYYKNQLQNRIEAGTISKEEAERFKNETPHYVRLQREVPKNMPNTLEIDNKGNAQINKNIKEFKGSTRDIISFKTAGADYTQKVMNEIRMNEFAKELAKTLGVSSSPDSTVNTLDEIFGVDQELIKDNGDGTYQLTFFNNGMPMTIPINKAIYEAMQPNKHYKWEDKTVFKGIRKLDSWRRALLTDKNPIFLATNMVKDLFDAPLNSKYPVAFAKNYPRAIKEIATGGKYFKQYQALGGLQNTYFENEGFKKQGSKLNPLNWIGKANEIIEQLPRLAEFISTMEKTGDVNEAMFNAAEITTNFKRGGDYTKALNRNGATFLNASVQGFSKQVRNFTEINNPTQAVQLLAKIVVLGIGPALFNDFVYEDDDEYKELQDYQKDRYYLIKGENGNWIRIPKGRAVSIFQSAARRTKYFAQGDKKAFKGFGELINSQIAPNNPFESNIISPFVNVATNKSWSGNPIVSEYMERSVKPKDQWDAKTDEFSKWLGQKTNLSPKKINYIVDQYSGAIGDFVLPNITKYKTHELNNFLDFLLNPARDKFTTNIANSNKSQNEFYDAITQNEKDHTEEGELRGKYLSIESKKISDLRNEMMDYQASDASDKDKIKKTREYLNEINKIAKEATEKSKDIKIGEYTTSIGDYTYYKDSSGKWRKESEKTAKHRSWDNISAEDYYAQKQAENNAADNRIENTVKALNFNSDDYEMYSYKIGQLKADKDAKGKTINGSKKKKVINYVNSLPISDVQKAALLKKQKYKVSGYDQKIANEINKSGLTQAEKNEIYSYLNLGR